MAHKKGQGSVKNGRDSVSKRLGVKKFGSELVVAGNIIVRQRARPRLHDFCAGRWECALRPSGTTGECRSPAGEVAVDWQHRGDFKTRVLAEPT